MDSPAPASVPASVPAQPAQNTPIAPVSAVPTSTATDLVTSVLGQHFNPTTGGVNPPPVGPVDIPIQPAQPAPQPAPPQDPVQQQAVPPWQDQPVQSVPANPPSVTNMDFQTNPLQRYAEEGMHNPFSDPIPEIPDESQLQLPDDPNDRGSVGRAFAQARYEAKQYRQVAEQLRERLVEASNMFNANSPEANKVLEAIKSQSEYVEQLETQLAQSDIRKSPKFREQFDVPVYQSIDAVAGVFSKNGFSEEDSRKLAVHVLQSESEEDVRGILDKLPTISQGEISVLSRGYYHAIDARNQALDDWQNTHSQYVEPEVNPFEQRVSNVQAGIEKLSSVVKFWDDPAFVKYRQSEVSDNLASWIAEAPEDQIITAALEGALVAPFAYQQIAKLQQANAELTRRLQAAGRLGAPGVTPFFQSAPAPVAPAPAPAEPADDINGDPVRAAEQMVRNTFARLSNPVN